MSRSYVLPLPTTPENAAKRQTAELLAAERVTGNHLRIAILVLALSILALLGLSLKAMQVVTHFKPFVIRIDDHGRPQADSLERADYQPREAEVKYFLAQFVTNYYGRIRATLRDRYTRSLYFLDAPIARAVIDANRKTKVLEAFVAGQSDEIDVNVKSIAIQDLRSAPYRASVDFEKVYYGSDHEERRRENYTANFVFTVKDRVPNNMILVNPLGFTITYFREDQAFQ